MGNSNMFQLSQRTFSNINAQSKEVYLHNENCRLDWGVYLISSNTGSIWAGKWHWLDKFLLYTVTDRNITLSGTRTHFTSRALGTYGSCKSNSLPVDRKYQKRQSRDNYIILLMWFFCRINTILMHCAGKPHLYPSF